MRVWSAAEAAIHIMLLLPFEIAHLLPTSRLVIEARARRAFRPIDVLSPERVASALLSKVRLNEVVSCCCHVVSCCCHEEWGEGSPNAKEAPAGICFERFLNLDLDAL